MTQFFNTVIDNVTTLSSHFVKFLQNHHISESIQKQEMMLC